MGAKGHHWDKVRFSITFWLEGEELDPELITARLGEEPCRSWKRGEPRAKPELPPFEKGTWGIQYSGEWGEPLEQLLTGFLSYYEAKDCEFSRLIKEYNGYLSIGLYYQKEYICAPVMGLSAEIIKRLAELNLAIYVNVYPTSKPGAEDTCCRK